MKTILNALGFLVPVVILPVLVVSQLIAMNTRSQESLKRNTDSAALHIVKDSLSCKGDSTKGKTVLYIGDSHTSYMYGWQDQLSKLTGMVTTTLAKGGMRTDWMLRNSRHMFAKKFDYCVIWGGANDAASMYSLDSSISNIQRMIDLGRKNGTKMIVLTGFDPKVVKITESNRGQWGFYPPRYVTLQSKMKKELRGALVVQNWYVSRQDGDCGDFICHMSASGHRKMAVGIYNEVFK